MTLVKYHPLNKLANRFWANALNHEVNPSFSRIFEDFFNNELGTWSTTPAVNIKESEKNFSLEFAAPGKTKEDFIIEVDDNVLKVSSEKQEKSEEKDEKGRFTRREFSYHSFSRAFKLPENIDTEKIEAIYKEGILYVNLPKREKSSTKTIQIG
jgi:HSP20 family protein